MREDDNQSPESFLERNPQAEMPTPAASSLSPKDYRPQGKNIREGISPFWPILIFLVLLGGIIAGGISWFMNREIPTAESEIVKVQTPAEPIPLPVPTESISPLPPERQTVPEKEHPTPSPLTSQNQVSTLESQHDSELEPLPEAEIVLPPSDPTTTPVEKIESSQPQPTTSTDVIPNMESPMLMKPEPPPALINALAKFDQDESEGELAIITKHAEAGWPEAQTALGVATAKGKGTPQHFKNALEWFRKAAEQDDGKAQYYLGQAYVKGTGVKKDPIEATAWFIISASHGLKAALTARDSHLTALNESDRHSAFNRARNLGPKIVAGWSHDPTNGTAVWLPSWYRTGSYSLRVEAPAKDGHAHGKGKIILKASLPGNSDRVFEGHFSHGYYFGNQVRMGEFHYLPTDDFLYRLPQSQMSTYQEVAFWLRVDYGVDFATDPCYVATNRTPDLVAAVPNHFPVRDDEAVKGVMAEAWEKFLEACPENFYVKLTVVPQEFGFGKNRFGHRIFAPQHATGSFYGKRGETLTVSNFENHARRAHEKEQRELARQQEREERQQKRKLAAQAAKTRGNPDIRGARLGMTLPELHTHFEREISTWDPPWDPGQSLPPFRQFVQSIHLTDGGRFSASFTSPVNHSVVFALVYEQDLRDGPTPTQLIADLEEKYGKPDETGSGGIWWSYQLVSHVEERLGAFMKVHFRVDKHTNKVEFLRLTINDAGFGSYDERAAYAAKRQADQRAFEARKSEKPKF